MKPEFQSSRQLNGEHYQRVLDMIPSGVAEFGPSGQILLYNKSFFRLCNCREEILGKYFWDAIEPSVAKKTVKDHFQKIISGSTHNKPIVFRLDQGDNTIDIQANLDIRTGDDGNILSIVAVIADVTEQRKISGAADRLANVVRQSSESIVLTDLEGNIQYVNPMFETLTGYSADEVEGKNPRVLRSDHNLYPADYYKSLWETIAGGNTWKGEFLNKRKNGDEFVEEASIFPVRDPNSGNITGYGAVKTDITRRRRLEEELKRSYDEVLSLKKQAESANEMKSIFLATMSHDIRTPLNGILGFADLLLKQDLNPKARDYAAKIVSSGRTLMALLSDILDFSKIEAGQLDINAGAFNLNDFLADLEAMFELQFKEKNVDFKIQMPPGDGLILYYDRWRLQQVIMNLLSNALKFTMSGCVTLDVRFGADGDVLFRVSDTGPGIPAEYIREIFEPFSQARKDGEYQEKGTGLGLAICRNLVQLMGGEISVESVLGRGSTFLVALPANAIVDSRKNKTDVRDTTDIKLQDYIFPSSILIAEDNPVNKELLEEQLRDYGFTSLIFASDGEEAVAMALKHQPALVLMDIQMPRLDGKEAIKRLRKKNFINPILVMSAYAMQDDIDSALRVGADGYITKPVDFDRFFYEVRKLLAVPQGESSGDSPGDIPSCCLEKSKERWLRFSPGVSPRLRSIFMKDADEKLAILNRARSGGDLREYWDEVKTIAHGYKGSAAHFGLSCLEKLARQLDEGMRDGLPERTLLGFLRQLIYLLEEIIKENDSPGR